jgi:hypothetical protein
MGYAGSDLWREDVRRADENWHVTNEIRTPFEVLHGTADGGRVPIAWRTAEIVEVNAEAATGSRYSVVTTPLSPLMRGIGGGPVLVTVLWPWQDAWCLQDDGDLHASYVAEHLTDGRFRSDKLHGGDLAALTKTVAYALGRTAVVDG